MNVINQFEEMARGVWNANLTPDRKSKKLLTIGKAIDSYIERVHTTGVVNRNDEWSEKAVERAISYLKGLSSDVKDLAECSRVLVARETTGH